MKRSFVATLGVALVAACVNAPAAHPQTEVAFGTVTPVMPSLGVIVTAKRLGFLRDDGLST
jgi:hypothetical protein